MEKPELKEKIREMYREGLPITRIARLVALSTAGVAHHLRGMKLRTKSEALHLAVKTGRYHYRTSANGRYIGSGGYVYINTSKGPILEHRLIMELHLGRILESCEHVHHKDGIRDHNDLDNLEVIRIDDHTRTHWEALTEEEQNVRLAPARKAWWGVGKGLKTIDMGGNNGKK